MKIGVTGHQKRAGIDWNWVETSMTTELKKLHAISLAFSSLAAGSDQLFANCIITAGIPLAAVIPLQNYETFFSGDSLENYRQLLAKSAAIFLDSDNNSPEASFFAAGRYIADQADLIFAVWDEQPAKGVGGTADVVDYACSIKKNIVIMNPIQKTIRQTDWNNRRLEWLKNECL